MVARIAGYQNDPDARLRLFHFLRKPHTVHFAGHANVRKQHVDGSSATAGHI